MGQGATLPLLVNSEESQQEVVSSYRSALRELSKQAALLSFSQFGGAILRTVNSGFLAQLGPAAVIAANPVATATSFYTSFNAVLFCISNCVQTEITNARATAGDARETHLRAVGQYFRQGLSMSLALAATASLLGYFTGDIFAFLGHGAAVTATINGFFRPFVYAGGMYPVIAQVVERRLLTGLQKPASAAVLTLAPTVLSTAAALLALKNSWSIAGFGYGFAIANWASFFGALIYFASTKEFAPYVLFHLDRIIDREKWRKIFAMGTASFISTALECLIVAILSGIIANAGNDAAFAYSVANLYALILVIPVWGLGASNSTMLTNTVRLAQIDAEKLYLTDVRLSQYQRKLQHQFHAGLILALGGTLSGFALYLAISRPLIGFFASTPVPDSLMGLTESALWVAAAGSVIGDAPRVMGSASSRAFMRNTHSAIYNFAGLSVGLLLAITAQFAFDFGALGMIVGFYLGVTLTGIIQCADIESAVHCFDPRSKPKAITAKAEVEYRSCWLPKSGVSAVVEEQKRPVAEA